VTLLVAARSSVLAPTGAGRREGAASLARASVEPGSFHRRGSLPRVALSELSRSEGARLEQGQQGITGFDDGGELPGLVLTRPQPALAGLIASRTSEASGRHELACKATVLGWSMGGLIAQVIAIRHPDFAKPAIVIGAVPPGPTPTPTEQLFATTARKPVYEFEDQVTLFFTQSDASRKAARRSLDRIAARTVDRESQVSVAAYTNQTTAIKGFHENLDALAKIEATDIPILVLNGNQDIANPVDNWYALGARARSAEIHVFLDAAHRSLHQFPERTAEEVHSFIHAHGG